MAINRISKESYKYKYDLAAAFNNNDIKYTAKKSGFFHILQIIIDELKDKNLLSSLFVEFNLVGTILSPDSPNKLNSLVYIRENDLNFADNIKCYSDSIINQFIEERNYTLFFHPDVFIDPESPQVCFSIIDKQLNESDLPFKNGIVNKKHDYYQKISNSDNFLIGEAIYDRDYSILLNQASKIRAKGIDVDNELLEFHKLFHYFISNNCTTAYIAVPILGAQTSNRVQVPNINNIQNIQGQGVVFIFLTIPSGEDKNLERKLKDVTSSLFLKIGDFVRLISYNYLFNLGLELQRKARKEAIKSAKAAIMSRNISHNLGSHVMAYMKQDLNSVEDMLNKGVLQYALPCEGVSLENKEIPYLVGIGRFISYLQERQDYIATVSTDYIPYPSIVNFKDAIYDELNPDYRFQRHKVEWKGHKPANILLENIAKSEGLSRKALDKDEPLQEHNNIIIKYGNFDGLNHEEDNAKSDYDNLRKINFSLPGGIMGRQAVFSIVENVIRNAAKHGIRKNGNNLTITFEIIDPLKEPNIDSAFSDKDDIRDLYIVKLTTDMSIDKDGLDKIKNAINDTLVENNGQLKQSNKGIKEMQISAAWLRGIKIEDLEDEQIRRKAPILMAQETLKNELQYVFCLPKVKEVAMITERFKEDSLTDDIQLIMKQKGWYIFNVDNYLECPNKDFSFVVIDPKIWENHPKVRECKDDLDRMSKMDSIEAEIINSIKENSHNRYFVAAKDTYLNEHLIKTDVFEKFSDFKTEQCFDDAVLNLYAQIADYSDGDIIAINDKGFKIQYEAKHGSGTLLSDIALLDDQIDNNYKYIYRKHNDTASQFLEFVEGYGKNKVYHDLKFVEGITGGNSTDRLVRHSDLDDLWVYKQIHAMKTRVAIFDERIFTRVTGYEMTDLTSSPVNQWNFDGLDADNAKKTVYNYDRKRKKIINNNVFIEWRNLKTIEEVKSFADKYLALPSLVTSKLDSTNSMVFHKKGIDVFTITWDYGGVFRIWGFVPNEAPMNGQYGTIENVGLINLAPSEGEKPTIEMFNRSVDLYDYLSVHQGLLDKIYEKFMVEATGEMKKEVTKALHDMFLAPSEGNDYLQGLIIHSGRSKPNEENMPQHQPFVQYSAIENAVFDCKYTLVELLDFARFE